MGQSTGGGEVAPAGGCAHWACFPARIGVATHLHVSSALRSNNCGVHRSAVAPPTLRPGP